MIGWAAVLIAALAVFAIKLAGHLTPERLLERPEVVRAAGLLTAGLLAALVAVQTAGGDHVRVDARLPALGVAAAALWWRAPFIVVVALAALTAAGLRLLGMA